MGSGITARFWGVRGTVPCPGPETVRYGGNTSCVEVRCGDVMLIFDAGSGLRALGRDLARRGGTVDAHLFLTHTHLDHILGLPFFKPAYVGCNRLQLWNGHLRRQGQTLERVIERIMEAPYFPVPLDIMHACIAFHDFEAGESFEVAPGVAMRTAVLDHPGGATGYRVDHAGHSFCYVTDTEHPTQGHDANVQALVAGADVMVYDATYTDHDYPRYRGWGHSTWQEGVRLCEAAGVARLIAFHHDPLRDDDALGQIDRELGRSRPGSFVAREGLTLEL
jgi:phosphoribosyl 1,2-cyclic phosphodiesterase